MTTLLKDVYDDDYLNGLLQQLMEVTSKVTNENDNYNIELFKQRDWQQLELKARMQRLAQVCLQVLSPSSINCLDQIQQLAPHFTGYAGMFVPEMVTQLFDSTSDDSDFFIAALICLKQITQYSSSEFAIRPFILAKPDIVMPMLLQWTKSDNPHIRRLASEGCRPRLPWAQALPFLKRDPGEIWLIIDQLKHDPDDYVYRSVANNINDISKDHPDQVIQFATEHINSQGSLAWVIKHGCRSLLKQTQPEILQLYGYQHTKHIQLDHFRINKDQFVIGDTLEFELALSSDSPLGKLRIEYIIDYQKSKQTRSKKIFQLCEKNLSSTKWKTSKRQSLAQMSTRKHYPGSHYLTIRINGQPFEKIKFELLAN